MTDIDLKWEGEISASHFLLGEEWGKCRRLHGHNWKIIIYASYDVDRGYVNYTDIKKMINNFDHKLLISKNVKIEDEGNGFVRIEENRMTFIMPREYIVVVPYENPTSERLAQYIADLIIEKWKDVLYDVHVVVYEDERSSVEFFAINPHVDEWDEGNSVKYQIVYERR